MCGKHYGQMRHYGKIPDRTFYDRNEIIVNDDFAKIILYDRKYNIIGKTLIDIEDVDKARNLKWRVANGYVVTEINNKNISLHRFITDCPNSLYIDHINHNVLDNRKENLRICTNAENCSNTRKRKDNTSGHKGVCWDKRKCRWHVYINKNKIRINIGYFQEVEDAVNARLAAEIKYHGEFRCKEEANG